MDVINQSIGNFGKYHWFLTFLIFLSKLSIGSHCLGIIFLDPPVTYTCASGAECCDNPDFDKSVFLSTITTEWNLTCKRYYLKEVHQMLFQVGVLIGSLIFGIASDWYGRRITMIVSVILVLVSSFGASFMPDYWNFTLMRMLAGSAVGGLMVVGFVLLIEYVGSVHKQLVAALYQVVSTVVYLLLPLIGYLTRDFRKFHLGISLFGVILLPYICFLPETPRWYIAVNQDAKAISLIEKVARRNGLPTEGVSDKIHEYKETVRDMKQGTFKDLFRLPNMRKNVLLMSVIWFGCGYGFYGQAQYISHMNGDIFINVLASSTVMVCASLLSIPAMWYMRRKTLIISTNLINSLVLFIIAVIPEGVLSTCLGCVGVLSCFISYVVIYLYCAEMFPTIVRSAAMGVASMMARLGSMLAPFVVGLRRYGIWCPPVGFGVVLLISAGMCVLLPETKDCKLPMTLEEGEEFGKRVRNTS